MQEIFFQVKNKKPVLFSEFDQEKFSEYSENKVVKAKVSGVRDPRSLDQLNSYFRLCKLAADNTENTDFDTKTKVDYQLRIKLGWISETIVVDKRVQFIPRSISYKEMRHLEACKYFDRAFKTISDFLGVPIEVLIDKTKKKA